ncbi:MAG: hypothetical protein OXG56_00950 [Gammaproteobacteria bacterium]|nr:hypothetical protein [Gammaproteobacteria bacterium]
MAAAQNPVLANDTPIGPSIRGPHHDASIDPASPGNGPLRVVRVAAFSERPRLRHGSGAVAPRRHCRACSQTGCRDAPSAPVPADSV